MQLVNTPICIIFEVNPLRNTSVIGKKNSKTSKMGCFSNFYGPLDPKLKIGLRNDTQFCITQILRGHWRKSVKKQKSVYTVMKGGRVYHNQMYIVIHSFLEHVFKKWESWLPILLRTCSVKLKNSWETC